MKRFVRGMTNTTVVSITIHNLVRKCCSSQRRRPATGNPQPPFNVEWIWTKKDKKQNKKTGKNIAHKKLKYILLLLATVADGWQL